MATKRNRSYFFQSTPNKSRLKTNDTPPEATFRDLLESIPFFKEVSSGATTLIQGLVRKATQSQYDGGTDDYQNNPLYVSPSQVKGDVSNLQGQIDTNATNISTNATNIATNAGDISTLQAGAADPSPVGSIVMFPTTTGPSAKWLQCNGQTLDSVANTQYADLFTLIGTTYGGTGASNFQLPDFQKKFIAGYQSGLSEYDTLGTGAGTATDSVTLVKANIPPHQHDADAGGGTLQTDDPGNHTHGIDIRDDAGQANTVGTGGFNEPPVYTGTDLTQPDGAHTHDITGKVGDGSDDGLAGTAFDNRPEYITMPFFIKVEA